jgi:hypothetical protein
MVTRRCGQLLALLAALVAATAIGCGSQNDGQSAPGEMSKEGSSATAAPGGQPGQPPTPVQPPPEMMVELAAAHCLIQYQGALRAPVEITRTKDEALKLAEDVSRRAKKGEDFAGLAREYSDDPTNSQRGGDLGVFQAGRMIPAFSKAVQALEVGQISDPIETDFGYHVIVRKNVEKITVQHILIQYKGAMKAPETVTRTKEEAQALCRSLHERLGKGEAFAALAAEHTDDPMSKPQGGRLPPFGKGQMVKPFEDAA